MRGRNKLKRFKRILKDENRSYNDIVWLTNYVLKTNLYNDDNEVVELTDNDRRLLELYHFSQFKNVGIREDILDRYEIFNRFRGTPLDTKSAGIAYSLLFFEFFLKDDEERMIDILKSNPEQGIIKRYWHEMSERIGR